MRISRITALLTSAALLLTVLPLAGFGQGTRGTISGQVVDQSGAAVKGAQVKLINVATGQEVRAVTSDAGGGYVIVEVEPAIYNIEASATGFAAAKIVDSKVEPNRNLRIDITLSAAGTAEEVTVSAGQELIDRDSPTLGSTVPRAKVEGLPLNGRNVLNLAQLQP